MVDHRRGRSRAAARPLLATARPWRALTYLILRVPLAAVTVLGLGLATTQQLPAAIAVASLLLVAYLVSVLGTAPAQRRAVRFLGRREIPDPHRPTDGRGPVARVSVRLREPGTWRELAHGLVALALVPIDAAVHLTWLGGSVLLAAPLLVVGGPFVVGPLTISDAGEAWVAVLGGGVLLVVAAYLLVGLANLHAWLSAAMLGPRGEEIRRQLIDLNRSRQRLVDAFDVERRRVERDLHDGAQQHLVALGMTLDLASIALEDLPDHAAVGLVSQARAQLATTVIELRELIHRIHPPALTELGLPGAIRELTERTPLPVRVRVELPSRLPESVETAAYFVLAEALTNASKHSGATDLDLSARVLDDVLVLEVVDDGSGGADPDRGTGLVGLGDRVAALGGSSTLTSPPGGPTALRVEIPCAPLGVEGQRS